MVNSPKVDVEDIILINSKLEIKVISYTLQIFNKPRSTKNNFIILFYNKSAITTGGAGSSPSTPNAESKISKNYIKLFTTLTPRQQYVHGGQGMKK